LTLNDKVFANFTDRDVSLDLQVVATHGMPLMFGAEKNRGLRFDPTRVQIEVVVIGENGVTEDDILVHDETNRTLAALLAAMEPPNHPMAIGVLYSNQVDTYESQVYGQIAAARNGGADLNDVIRRGHTWRVEG